MFISCFFTQLHAHKRNRFTPVQFVVCFFFWTRSASKIAIVYLRKILCWTAAGPRTIRCLRIWVKVILKTREKIPEKPWLFAEWIRARRCTRIRQRNMSPKAGVSNKRNCDDIDWQTIEGTRMSPNDRSMGTRRRTVPETTEKNTHSYTDAYTLLLTSLSMSISRSSSLILPQLSMIWFQNEFSRPTEWNWTERTPSSHQNWVLCVCAPALSANAWLISLSMGCLYSHKYVYVCKHSVASDWK